MNILVLNAGSNSLKFEIVDAKSSTAADGAVEFGRSLVSGAYDDIGKKSAAFRLADAEGKDRQEALRVDDHGDATSLLIHWIQSAGARRQTIAGFADIARIGIRVVHGGSYFTDPAEVSDEVVQRIASLVELAPLHNDPALKVIDAVNRAQLAIPMVAVFDTVFHQTIPDETALYPVPLALAKRHGIRRYGFHGISHRYMMLRYSQIVQRPAGELNIITLHLEGGSSAAAIRKGKSVDTSMGFTPLERLMMGTRCGDIDPAIVTYLMRKQNWDTHRVEQFLNQECGLAGVSGRSGDTRLLHDLLDEPSVNLAIDMFALRVRKYIGSYLAVLGGCDAIIFGGGIGENTPYVRERIANNLAWCGAELDKDRNERTIDCEGPITTAESRLPMWVVPTQEGLMIAHDVANHVI